jgi:hypothetical protein
MEVIHDARRPNGFAQRIVDAGGGLPAGEAQEFFQTHSGRAASVAAPAGEKFDSSLSRPAHRRFLEPVTESLYRFQ